MQIYIRLIFFSIEHYNLRNLFERDLVNRQCIISFFTLKLADTLKKSVPSEKAEEASKEVDKGIFLDDAKNLQYICITRYTYR